MTEIGLRKSLVILSSGTVPVPNLGEMDRTLAHITSLSIGP